MKPKIIVSVINDLVTDQRVHRSCMALTELNYEVLLVGREMEKSLPMNKRSYTTKRMKLLFEKGPLFYAEYNIRLFFFLLFHRSEALLSNDLDTLLPNLMVSKLRKRKLFYDAHEYFTEVPELTSRPNVQRIWKRIEQFCLSRISFLATVNDSIAKLYHDKYGVKTFVVRNVPVLNEPIQEELEQRESVLILQGAGINIDRGGEELVEAMQFIQGAQLWIIGDGDAVPLLKKMVAEKNLESKVVFKGKVPLSELKQLTKKGVIGFSLDKNTNINYQFSLPNKLFDYFQAQCAVVVSPLVEVAKIVDEYQAGVVLDEVSPKAISQVVNSILSNPEKLDNMRLGAIQAAKKLNWEEEKRMFYDFMASQGN